MSIWRRVRTLLGLGQPNIVETEDGRDHSQLNQPDAPSPEPGDPGGSPVSPLPPAGEGQGEGPHDGASPSPGLSRERERGAAATGAQPAGPVVPLMQVNRDSEVEKAARLRIQQVQRALRGAAGEASSDETAETPGAEPPWARGKNRPGRLPSGPGRPQDAFFVLTVVLASDLPDDGEALARLLVGPLWPEPRVRLIPLVRNGVAEPGYSAEVTCGERRAFMLYRKQPYGEAGGAGHVGLFIGGPAVPAGEGELPPALVQRRLEEGRLLGALARALLESQPDALGLYENRSGKAWKPRQQALDEMAAEKPTDAAPPTG